MSGSPGSLWPCPGCSWSVSMALPLNSAYRPAAYLKSSADAHPTSLKEGTKNSPLSFLSGLSLTSYSQAYSGLLCFSTSMFMRVRKERAGVMAVDFQEATSSSLDPAMIDGKFMKSVQGGGTPSAPHLELGHAAHVGDMLPPSSP